MNGIPTFPTLCLLSQLGEEKVLIACWPFRGLVGSNLELCPWRQQYQHRHGLPRRIFKQITYWGHFWTHDMTEVGNEVTADEAKGLEVSF